MPHIVLTEDDFQFLSKGTQEELLNFVREKFAPRDISKLQEVLTLDVGYAADQVQKEAAFNEKLMSARKLAEVNFLGYQSDIKRLQKDLPKIVKTGVPINFDALSIELALSVIAGLSDVAKKVVWELIQKRKLTRDELADLLGGPKKINGTIGSINRRLAKRFNAELYGDYVNKVKLIEFDNGYQLTCDPYALEVAYHINETGYQSIFGNLTLKFGDEKNGDSAKVKIEALAIELANEGYAYVDKIRWDYQSDDKTTGTIFSVDVARTVSSAIITIQTDYGSEWVTEEPHHMTSRILGNPGNFGAVPELEVDVTKINCFWSEEETYKEQYTNELEG